MMAKNKSLNAEALLKQLEGLLSQQPAQQKPTKPDNRKVVAALTQAQKALGRAISLLTGKDDEATSTDEVSATSEAAPVDADAPYGRKKDGTPKQRPGRLKA